MGQGWKQGPGQKATALILTREDGALHQGVRSGNVNGEKIVDVF